MCGNFHRVCQAIRCPRKESTDVLVPELWQQMSVPGKHKKPNSVGVLAVPNETYQQPNTIPHPYCRKFVRSRENSSYNQVNVHYLKKLMHACGQRRRFTSNDCDAILRGILQTVLSSSQSATYTSLPSPAQSVIHRRSTIARKLPPACQMQDADPPTQRMVPLKALKELSRRRTKGSRSTGRLVFHKRHIGSFLLT